MSDYIDREAVIAEIPREMDMQDLYLPVHFIELLNDIPTADVVEVVRCKDCKHHQHGTSHPLWCNAWCSENDSYWMNKVEADGFCYRGEREESKDG